MDMQIEKDSEIMCRSSTIWTRKFSFQKDHHHSFTSYVMIWVLFFFDLYRQKPLELLGVQMAPLNVPWKRRMETLVVAFWISTFLFGGPLILIILIWSLFTSFVWVPLLYLLWYIWDRDTPHRGGRRIKWMTELRVWRHFINYFPIRLVKTENLDPSHNYLFAAHPHGVLAEAFFGCFSTQAAGFDDKFPGLTPHMLTLNRNFRYPFYRDYILAGGSCPASRESMNYLLSRPGGGQVAVIVPGGAKESLEAHSGRQDCVLFLKNRKGFVKIAMQNGTPLVPVFAFGENEIFDQVQNEPGSWIRRGQNWIQGIVGFAPVLILGRGLFQYSFGIFPRRSPITVVVGGAIFSEKIQNPTAEQVDLYHKEYVIHLTKLFEKYKGRYGMENCYIKIV